MDHPLEAMPMIPRRYCHQILWTETGGQQCFGGHNAHPAGSILIVCSLFVILWLALVQVCWLVGQRRKLLFLRPTRGEIPKCGWRDGARIKCVYLLYLILILSFPGELSLFCWANFPLCFSPSYRERGAAMVSLCLYFYFKTVTQDAKAFFPPEYPQAQGCNFGPLINVVFSSLWILCMRFVWSSIFEA